MSAPGGPSTPSGGPSIWQLQSHPGAAVAFADSPAGLAADTRRTAVCRDNSRHAGVRNKQQVRPAAHVVSVKHTTPGCAEHYLRSTPRGYPSCRQPPIVHLSPPIMHMQASQWEYYRTQPITVTLPTFTPPATHQAATSRPRAPAAGPTTQALPAATQPPPDQGGITQSQTTAGQTLMASATFFPIPEKHLHQNHQPRIR